MENHPDNANDLYDDPQSYYDNLEAWSPAILAAAAALWGRLNVHQPDEPAFKDLDNDTRDHYCIAAQVAVRAFHRTAETNLPNHT